MSTTGAYNLPMCTLRNSKLSSSKLSNVYNISSLKHFQLNSTTLSSTRTGKIATRAMSGSNEHQPVSGLPIDLKGKRAFIAGVADDYGYGWAIAKSLAVPELKLLLVRGCVLRDGSLMGFGKIYPLDADFDNPEDVPEKEVAESVKKDFGTIDILVHSLANGPEVRKPLLETSRKGYLAALSASSYSYVTLLKHFAPIMNPGSSSISLTYIASKGIIPGYGGGMSSAKAALESDIRVLAFEVGRKNKIRVNAISAGPLRSQASKAVEYIDLMIDYSLANAPLQKPLSAEEVGNAAAFLASPLASGITGSVICVDNGLNAMGVGVDSPTFKGLYLLNPN